MTSWVSEKSNDIEFETDLKEHEKSEKSFIKSGDLSLIKEKYITINPILSSVSCIK